ncbi:MAG TPA: hypothetical protein VGK13_06965 [Methanocellaceae archaeon]
MKDIEAIRADLEKFTEEIELEIYENGSGQKDDLNTSAIYARYDHVFTDERLIDEVSNRAPYHHGVERRRMDYLYAQLIEGFIGRKTADISDKVDTAETRAEIEIDGKKVPFRYTSVVLSNEPDRSKREAIDLARNPIFEELNPLRLEELEKSHQLSEEFGYKNYVDMCMDIKGIDLYALKKQMQNVLARTDRLYTRYFKNACSNVLNLSLGDVRKHDMGFLFRAKVYDKFFAQENLVTVAEDTLTGIGLPLSENPNIHLDTEVREKKSPRAFCSPIKVPEQVMLCIMPKGGMDDYRAFFHEMGHSQHFSHVDARMPYEFKCLGDVSVTESYAFLFEHLMQDKTWLMSKLSLSDEDATNVVQFNTFQKLFMIRRYAAKLLYELELHSGASHPEKIYAASLEDALKFKNPENQYLADLDTGFYSAGYLRAWMFEVQLRNVLMEQFGDEWWNHKACGDYMKNMWSSGQKYMADELARELGYYGIDEYPMVKEMEKKLRY